LRFTVEERNKESTLSVAANEERGLTPLLQTKMTGWKACLTSEERASPDDVGHNALLQTKMTG